MPCLETTKVSYNGLMATQVWVASKGPYIPTGKDLSPMALTGRGFSQTVQCWSSWNMVPLFSGHRPPLDRSPPGLEVRAGHCRTLWGGFQRTGGHWQDKERGRRYQTHQMPKLPEMYSAVKKKKKEIFLIKQTRKRPECQNANKAS